MNAKLTLKFSEYVETWSGVLKACYSRGLDKSIVEQLELTDETFIKYSMELAMVMLVISMRIWFKSKTISLDVKEMVRDAVLDSFYREIFNNKNDESFIAACKSFFKERNNTFYELCPHMDKKNSEKQKMELIGLARYLCAQVSNKGEANNIALFEKLGLIFIDTLMLSERLTRNSSLDIQFRVSGKPKFIVQQ